MLATFKSASFAVALPARSPILVWQASLEAPSWSWPPNPQSPLPGFHGECPSSQGLSRAVQTRSRDMTARPTKKGVISSCQSGIVPVYSSRKTNLYHGSQVGTRNIKKRILDTTNTLDDNPDIAQLVSTIKWGRFHFSQTLPPPNLTGREGDIALQNSQVSMSIATHLTQKQCTGS